MSNEKITHIVKSIGNLNDHQVSLIEKVVDQLRTPFLLMNRLISSNIITDCVLKNFGDILRLHHCFSKEPFTKDKFEYALISALNSCNIKPKLAPKGNPGHDIYVSGIKVSLKTQADTNIKSDKLHISKFMELGKGEWGDQLSDLNNLLERYLKHLEEYEKVYSLRCLSKFPGDWHYELVEIPKDLLLEAKGGELVMKFQSKQFPKPGYCSIYDSCNVLKFQLYFDGGSERKLQIKNLMKKNCIVHANWKFSDINLI